MIGAGCASPRVVANPGPRGGVLFLMSEVPLSSGPLSSEHGKYKAVKARFWLWFSGNCPQNLLSCSLFALKRCAPEKQVISQTSPANAATKQMGFGKPETRNPKPKPNLKPKTRNPKSETRNQKPEARNSKPETQKSKLEARNPEPETRTPNPKPETRNQKPEARHPNPESQNPKPESRNPKPGARNPEPEARNPKPQTRNSNGWPHGTLEQRGGRRT